MVPVAAQTILTSPFFYASGLAICAVVWCLRHCKHLGPVLTFEKIGIPPKNSPLQHTWTSADALEKILRRLVHKQYTFLTPGQLRSPQPKKSVCCVFAGGYRSFYTHAFPLLQKYQIPAVLLLAPDAIGTYNRWQDPHEEPWQDLLTQHELNELKKSALLSFGALPLGGQDISACEPEQAAFAVKESIYRLKNYQNITPTCWSNYPARTLTPECLAALEKNGLTLPFIQVN